MSGCVAARERICTELNGAGRALAAVPIRPPDHGARVGTPGAPLPVPKRVQD
jgi:hypothetical protein